MLRIRGPSIISVHGPPSKPVAEDSSGRKKSGTKQTANGMTNARLKARALLTGASDPPEAGTMNPGRNVNVARTFLAPAACTFSNEDPSCAIKFISPGWPAGSSHRS